MTNVPIEIDSDKLGLNIKGISNVPVCPLCTTPLESVSSNYKFKQNIPDTRWFWCSSCAAHLGYHRMKAKWSVDPIDFDNSNRVREYFGFTNTDT